MAYVSAVLLAGYLLVMAWRAVQCLSTVCRFTLL